MHVRTCKVFCTERSLHALINSISPAEVLAPTTGQQSWRRFVAEWVRTISTIQEQPQGQYKRGPEKEEKSHKTGQKSECFWVGTALSTWLVFPFYLLGFECKLYMINVIVKINWRTYVNIKKTKRRISSVMMARVYIRIKVRTDLIHC